MKAVNWISTPLNCSSVKQVTSRSWIGMIHLPYIFRYSIVTIVFPKKDHTYTVVVNTRGINTDTNSRFVAGTYDGYHQAQAAAIRIIKKKQKHGYLSSTVSFPYKINSDGLLMKYSNDCKNIIEREENNSNEFLTAANEYYHEYEKPMFFEVCCIDNKGFEKSFDVGVEYFATPFNGNQIMVEDRFGKHLSFVTNATYKDKNWDFKNILNTGNMKVLNKKGSALLKARRTY